MASRPGYQSLQTGGGVSYVLTSPLGVPVQWVLYAKASNSLTLIAKDIIDDARIRHASFSDVQMPDGAAIRWLNQRQRYLLLMFRGALKGLVTKTVRTLERLPVGGTLVGVTQRGVPYRLETPGDGYAIYLTDANQVPYIDTSGVPIADDPIHEGWPLPTEIISVMAFKGVQAEGAREVPITVKTEHERTTGLPGRMLAAFLSGNRVVPLRHRQVPMANDLWRMLESTELSYIGLARITSICCLLTLPTILTEALTAGLAELFAKQSKECTPVERAQFQNDARRAEGQLSEMSADMGGEMRTNSVIFKG